jgi:serine/threonine protein kinase
MSQCFNPDCLSPNPAHHKFCQKCGGKLLLKGHFRGTRYLGEGGFGRTFVGIDEHKLNSSCVIKQFLPLQQGSGTLQKCIQLFEQEAQLLEKLGKHSQIPDLLAFFEQDNKLYLIQEYIEGKNLLEELLSQGRFQENKVSFFLLEMLPVLDFIHKKSVIHRDIKPENIIRRKHQLDPLIYGKNVSDLVLIDFGVSKQVSATMMTRIGTGIGTPGYAPPEQNRGMVHPSSDLYSLAVTAIRLLTGVIPEERNGSVIDELFDLYDLRWVWKEWLQKNSISINQDLAQILDKMLADKVSERFPSAEEVLNALQPSSPTQNQPKVSPSPAPSSPTQNQPKVSPSPAPSNIELQTSRADFRQLDPLLASGKWKEADQETGKVMLKIMGREKKGWLRVKDCQNFPPQELRIIDQLWLKYSQDKFGFSVQKKIWVKNGGKLDGSIEVDTYRKFADAVGWREKGQWLNYDQLTFSTNAVEGHLPGGGGWGVWGSVLELLGWVGRLPPNSFLFSKL